jgi:hypothetical protein
MRQVRFTRIRVLLLSRLIREEMTHERVRISLLPILDLLPVPLPVLRGAKLKHANHRFEWEEWEKRKPGFVGVGLSPMYRFVNLMDLQKMLSIREWLAVYMAMRTSDDRHLEQQPSYAGEQRGRERPYTKDIEQAKWHRGKLEFLHGGLRYHNP